MEFSSALSRLHESAEYKSWKKKNPDDYLIYGFAMFSGNEIPSWQVGYYDREKRKITDFTVSDTITENPDAEPFNDNRIVSPLDMSGVKVTSTEAGDTADAVQKESYKSHAPLKKIFVLQNIEDGLVWNITFVTQTFNTLNIKVDAKNGKVLKHELISIFSVEK